MKKVLILGHGYVGTYLYKELKKDHDVDIVSKAFMDYTDPDILETNLFEYKPDYVVNCSGYTGRPNVDGCEDNKKDCWKLNVTAPSMVNRLCKSMGIPYIHISSGCVYSGYDKAWSEDDPPNYGVFNNESSFYSKSKHAYELACGDYGLTIRIRMPFDDDMTDRSIVSKLLKYDKLIDPGKNSKTYIRDLCSFIAQYIGESRDENDIINLVNSDPLSTGEVIEILKQHGYENPAWKVGVEFAELGTKCGRSNCTLDISKLKNKYGYTPLPETVALNKSLDIHGR
jgi:dTDP-4-dehydrorhamnose reductase